MLIIKASLKSPINPFINSPDNSQNDWAEDDRQWINSEQLAEVLRRRRVFEAALAIVMLGALTVMLGWQVWLRVDDGQTVATWAGLAYNAEPAAALMEGLYGSVTIELADHSELAQAFVLINGQKVAAFTSSELTLRVFDGDILEIDTTAYRTPVRFRLGRVSAGIRDDLLQEIELCGERGQIGRIEF